MTTRIRALRESLANKREVNRIEYREKDKPIAAINGKNYQIYDISEKSARIMDLAGILKQGARYSGKLQLRNYLDSLSSECKDNFANGYLCYYHKSNEIPFEAEFSVISSRKILMFKDRIPGDELTNERNYLRKAKGYNL